MRHINSFIRLSLVCLAMLFLMACQDKEDEPQQINYQITFISNGGSSLQPIHALSDSSLLEPNEPIREGFIFLGWYYDESLEEPVTWPITLDQNITLYAKWQTNILNHFTLSYYELDTIQIAKVLPITKVNQGSDRTFLFLSSEGRLYERIEIYNQITYQLDYVFMELPISKHPILVDLKIVDVIAYEPVYLIKVETGEWFGIEMGPYATGDFLGEVNELVSIDDLLDLDADEHISQMHNAGRFFYTFTSKHRLFLAGILEIDDQIIHSFNTPLEITHEFELDEDEYFIPHDNQLTILGYQELTIKTNKRIFIPTSLAAIMLNQPSLTSNNTYFIDVNDINEHQYIDVKMIALFNDYYLYLLTADKVITFEYADQTVYDYTYDINPNPDETFSLYVMVPISNQNRIYYEPDRVMQFDLNGAIKELVAGIYSLNQTYINYGPLFITEENNYYELYEGVDHVVDITDLVASYTFTNGFWMKDQTYYAYDHLNRQLVKNEFIALSLVQERVNSIDSVNPPQIEDIRYQIDGYSHIPINHDHYTGLFVTPIIINPVRMYTYIYLYIDDMEVLYRYEQLPINKVFTVEELLEYLEVLNPINVDINLDYIDVNRILINDILVNSIEVKEDFDTITIYFNTKE